MVSIYSPLDFYLCTILLSTHYAIRIGNHIKKYFLVLKKNALIYSRFSLNIQIHFSSLFRKYPFVFIQTLIQNKKIGGNLSRYLKGCPIMYKTCNETKLCWSLLSEKRLRNFISISIANPKIKVKQFLGCRHC